MQRQDRTSREQSDILLYNILHPGSREFTTIFMYCIYLFHVQLESQRTDAAEHTLPNNYYDIFLRGGREKRPGASN